MAIPPPDGYGSAFADVYDDWYPADGGVPVVSERLAELANGGPVLELGVGTGRLAVPLAARGVAVWGLDNSLAMLDRLAAKDEHHLVHAVHGEMAVIPLPDDAPVFSLVFAAFNSFFLLTSEAAQQACLRRCHDVLADGGRLVLELYSPAPAGPGHTTWTDTTVVAGGRQLRRTYERAAHDEAVLVGQTEGRPWTLRPITLGRIDALADAAGFGLENRWGNWLGAPFFAAL